MAKYESILILKDKVSESLKKISKNLENLNGKVKNAEDKLSAFKKKTENLSKVGKNLSSFGQKMTIGFTLPIIAAGGAMVKLASDMEETVNKIDVSFGESSSKVKEWAKSSIKNMGLAQQSALDSAALYGDMATGMGMTQSKAADLAMTLTQLGADLASFKNVSNDMAQTALKGIFTGETESLKGLGIVMTETELQQFGLQKGMLKMIAVGKKSRKMRVQRINELTQEQKIMLRYQYVMSKTANAQGDFLRTGSGAANQTRMFQEQMKELGVLFGQELLPCFTKLIKKINEIMKVFGEMSPKTRKIILICAGLSAVIGPLLIALGALISIITSLNAALVFLAANPVVLTIIAITAAITAVGVAIFLLWKNWDKVWSAIKTTTLNTIKNITNWLDELIQKLGWIAYLIPGLNSYAVGKKIAGGVSSNINKSDNSIRTTNNNQTYNYGNTFNLSGSFKAGSDLGSLLDARNNMPYLANP